MSAGLEKWSRSSPAKHAYYVGSCEEMILFGEVLGRTLRRPQVVAFFGDLGSGKTTLAKGIVGALCGITSLGVASPTFQYLQFYSGNNVSVAHFDLWRLRNLDEFLSLGLEEYLSSEVVLIEWPDRIQSLLPPSTLFVETKVCGLGREVVIR